MAASQNVQMLRAWGSGMVETDDFYDLCDRKGIMVMQEWPTAWNSHDSQPYDILEQTVRSNTLRLRNHPSLAIYTGGNESSHPFGRAIDMMGRLNVELDGTRDFHRGEPCGGSAHDYDVYWGGGPLDHAFTMQAAFHGEFGIASYPCQESMQKVLPEDEQAIWPPPADKSFAYHTPIFNTANDLQRLTRMSQFFTEGKTMERFITGGQLAQAVGVRHALERARTRWPQCTGALYYKLNDNSPAASWSNGRLVRRGEDLALLHPAELLAAVGRDHFPQEHDLRRTVGHARIPVGRRPRPERRNLAGGGPGLRRRSEADQRSPLLRQGGSEKRDAAGRIWSRPPSRPRRSRCSS